MSTVRKLELYVLDNETTGEELILYTPEETQGMCRSVSTAREALEKEAEEVGETERVRQRRSELAAQEVQLAHVVEQTAQRESIARRIVISYKKPSYRRFLEIRAAHQSVSQDDAVQTDVALFHLSLLEEAVKETKSEEEIDNFSPNVAARFGQMVYDACWPNENKLFFYSSPAKTPSTVA